MPAYLRSIALKIANGSSLRARMARATAWMVGGSGLNQGFGMLVSIVTARILGKTAFGEFGAIRSTTMSLAVLAGGGLGLATTRYVAVLRTQDPERAGRLMGLLMTLAWCMTGVAAVTCALLAQPIAVHVMRSERLALPLAISALAIVFSTVSGVQIGVIAGFEAFRPVAVLLALEGFAGGVMMIAGSWFGGVTGAIVGYVLGMLVTFVLRRRQMMIECAKAGIVLASGTIKDARAELPFLVGVVLPLMLLILGAQPAEWLVRMMLVRGPDGMAAMGVFTAAYSWAQVVQFVPSQIASPALTILSNLSGAGDWAGFRRTLYESCGAVLVTATAIAVPLALAGKYVMSLYGPSFKDGVPVFSAIVLAYVIGSVSLMLRSSFLAAGREWLQFAFTLAWGVTLPLSFLVLGRRTAFSLAVCYGISFFLIVLAQLLAARLLFRGSSSSGKLERNGLQEIV